MSREPFSEEFVASLHCADKWTKAVVAPESAWIEPGQFAAKRLESPRWSDFGCQPIACCCMPRRVDLTDDRSDFTRESFGVI